MAVIDSVVGHQQRYHHEQLKYCFTSWLPSGQWMLPNDSITMS